MSQILDAFARARDVYWRSYSDEAFPDCLSDPEGADEAWRPYDDARRLFTQVEPQTPAEHAAVLRLAMVSINQEAETCLILMNLRPEPWLDDAALPAGDCHQDMVWQTIRRLEKSGAAA